ncbi:molybdopterin-dependent oxidoreductase [Rhodococcus erythropolis]
MHPYEGDANPSPMLGNLAGSVRSRARVSGPAVRRGWLENGPGPSDRRGADEFVSVSWDELTELLSRELRRVVDAHGNNAIFGGSYGWASAGRFHHAQSQVHRFESAGWIHQVSSQLLARCHRCHHAACGRNALEVVRALHVVDVIAKHSDLLVSFGGVPIKNTGVNAGGTSDHPTRGALDAFRARGGKIVSFSPLRDDVEGDCEWIAPVPGTDVAIMLALAFVLASEDLHDRDFLGRFCVGYERFEDYLLGRSDGVQKDPRWAQKISGVSAEFITDLARRMASGRTLVTVTWSLQRIKHGEQAPWMGVTLAAMLGQFGLPGGGFGHGYGSMNEPGLAGAVSLADLLARCESGVGFHSGSRDFRPAAFARGGVRLRRPTPDLSRHPVGLLGRWQSVSPPSGSPEAATGIFASGHDRRSRSVLDADGPQRRHRCPSTTSLERNDLSCTRNDPLLVAMQQVVPPFENSRDDYDTFAALASALGFGEQFTEGRSSQEWIEHLYGQWRPFVDADGGNTPTFEDFWAEGHYRMRTEDNLVLFGDFRENPEKYPLSTPSGKIEIFSETIESFGYDDCAGHPRWYEPDEWLGGPRASQFPLHLIANQPKTRLHSQLDHGAASQASKIQGREPIRMHPMQRPRAASRQETWCGCSTIAERALLV